MDPVFSVWFLRNCALTWPFRDLPIHPNAPFNQHTILWTMTRARRTLIWSLNFLHRGFLFQRWCLSASMTQLHSSVSLAIEHPFEFFAGKSRGEILKSVYCRTGNALEIELASFTLSFQDTWTAMGRSYIVFFLLFFWRKKAPRRCHPRGTNIVSEYRESIRKRKQLRQTKSRWKRTALGVFSIYLISPGRVENLFRLGIRNRFEYK